MAREPIWTPISPKSTVINAFRLYVNRAYDLNLVTYQDLHAWSVRDIVSFVEATYNFVGLKTSSPYQRVIENGDQTSALVRWFPGAKLNFAENLLGPGLSTRPNGISVTLCEEGLDDYLDVTYFELERRTAVWAQALRKLGVKTGDRVSVVLPNRIDCLVILLASASIRAIFSATSPDMGAVGIVESDFPEVNKKLRELVPELKCSIVIHGPLFDGTDVKLAKDVLLSDSKSTSPVLVYEELPFDHPVYILYSSGTTGGPKCITHAAGRALLSRRKSISSGTKSAPVRPLIAALSTDARIVLYDGSPLARLRRASWVWSENTGHGDFICKIPDTGGYKILGRSDGVLNPGGVRFGSAEIYGVIDKMAGIQDSLCITPEVRLDEDLKGRTRRAIATASSPRHVPAQIFQLKYIHYTVNGKKIEHLVRDVVAGKPTGEARTAVNPECLQEYKKFVLHLPPKAHASKP